MMVKAKGINVSISTIYYWIHDGHLGLPEADILYPRKVKTKKKQAETINAAIKELLFPLLSPLRLTTVLNSVACQTREGERFILFIAQELLTWSDE